MIALIRQDRIQPFVQDELGCQCPNEVFTRIESSVEVLDELRFQRILTGGRLLVYLVQDASQEQLLELMDRGCAERDRAGYNRYRLVVSGSGNAEPLALVKQRTRSDDKAHLHQLSNSVLRAFT